MPSELWDRDESDVWKFRIIDVTNMDIIHDTSYTDKELLNELISDFGRRKNTGLPRQEEVGLDYGFHLSGLSNKTNFVKRYWNVVVSDEFEYGERHYRSNGSWRIKKVEPKPHSHGPNKGHPDYEIHWDGQKASPLDGDKLYMELKFNGDKLRTRQFDWIFENAIAGYRVWILVILTPSKVSLNGVPD